MNCDASPIHIKYIKPRNFTDFFCYSFYRFSLQYISLHYKNAVQFEASTNELYCSLFLNKAINMPPGHLEYMEQVT